MANTATPATPAAQTAQAGGPAEAKARAEDLAYEAYKLAFFARLKSRNYVPQSEKQAQNMLDAARQLMAIEARQVKQAADNADDFFGRVNAELSRHTGLAPSPAAEASVKEAAEELARNPAFVEAVLVAHAAQAQAA